MAPWDQVIRQLFKLLAALVAILGAYLPAHYRLDFILIRRNVLPIPCQAPATITGTPTVASGTYSFQVGLYDGVSEPIKISL
jgi:hypothetical protein